ncbi:MAG TPA: hypothetical protein VF998_00350, partial [Candidatus Limnocylindria bacterium]
AIDPGFRSTECRNERPAVSVGGVSVMEIISLCSRPPMYFYEIHEGDEDVGTAVLLGHEERVAPEEFFRLVKRARELVKASFEEASLSEAIANELQRASGFVHVTDDLLVASVNVDESDALTYLVASDEGVRTVYVEADETRGDRSN